MAEHVRFADDCPDMPAAMQMADLVVLPAIQPLPTARAVVAAQAMGKPVVVSNVGALPELVMPAMTGWLVPSGDVGELAWAIERALSLDPEVRQRLARAGAGVRQGRVRPRADGCPDARRVPGAVGPQGSARLARPTPVGGGRAGGRLTGIVAEGTVAAAAARAHMMAPRSIGK